MKKVEQILGQLSKSKMLVIKAKHKKLDEITRGFVDKKLKDKDEEIQELQAKYESIVGTGVKHLDLSKLKGNFNADMKLVNEVLQID